jgi:hypothetical protein
MANRYGEAALIAARQGPQNTPAAAWEMALERLYPTSPAARKKGSPRGAFLGLCEAGLVKGVPAGNYKASRDNKAVAVRAARLLMEGGQRWSLSTLWRAATDDTGIKEDGQMDVVFALWKNDLIVPDAGQAGFSSEVIS